MSAPTGTVRSLTVDCHPYERRIAMKAWRGEDLAESLGKVSEPAGRHMPKVIGSDHVLDRLDLLLRQLLRRVLRARQAVVEAARRLVAA